MEIERSSRIESELNVKTYLDQLKYALAQGAHINFQENRKVDDTRDKRYTNKYTVQALFPNENPTDALKRELKKLTVENYMRTVQDIRFPKRSDMWEFGKEYHGKGDVYIKIRVELFDSIGRTTTFVMSFHFAEKPFQPEMFPYRKM